jgi:tRNA modification GTPase
MTVMTLVERLRESIRAHLNDNRVGEILRDGIHITISGPPNAGKSSFLNTLGKIPLHDIYLLMHRI